MRPLVTVFIPCYNQSSVLSRAINSVLTQTYKNLEIIVGDDCSTDETSLVVQTFLHDSRVQYKKSEKNLGRVGNYRRGLCCRPVKGRVEEKRGLRAECGTG